MKRTAELRGLSEDHHHGLVQARRLRRAASGEGVDPTETSGTFLDFWQKDTSAHFRKEEEVLLPVLVRHGGNLLGQKQVAEMLAQHAEIRGLVMELSDEVERGGVRTETLQAIGERLEKHIRLEEREVFPMLEESLPKEALQEISDRLDTFESGPRTEPWVPSWGISYNPWPGPGDSEGGGSD
jgi:hemerythrin-like domain-containing protein